MHRATIVFAVVLAIAENVFSFPCRTSFGLISVPEINGYVPGDISIKRTIQRTKRMFGGQSGKVVCVFLPEEDKDKTTGFSKLISLSQTSIEAEISSKDFEKIQEATKQQIGSIEGQIIQGMIFGGFTASRSYYYNTLEIHAVGAVNQAQASAFTVMGGIHLRGHLYSFVAHTSTTLDESARSEWIVQCITWIEKLLAANVDTSPKSAEISTVANVDDYLLMPMTMERTDRERTKGRAGSETLDVKFEHARSMKEVSPRENAFLAFEREVDGYVFRLDVGEVRYDAELNDDLEAFKKADDEDATTMIDALAKRLLAIEKINSDGIGESGIIEDDGRRLLWLDSWQMMPSGSEGSGCARRTLWLPGLNCRALHFDFTLRDKRSNLVPVADLSHFNVVMMRVVDSISIQNKKQF